MTAIITKEQAINDALNFVMEYNSPIEKENYNLLETEKEVIKAENKLLNNIFIHKNTKHKIEVAVFVALDKNRKNIDTAYSNMDKMPALKKKEQDYLIQKALYLGKEYKKSSTTKFTEGKKKYIRIEKKSFFARTYKCVGTSWGKLELTGYVGNRTDRKKLVKTMEKGIRSIIKGIESSTSTYRLQAGDEFEPLDYYYNKES